MQTIQGMAPTTLLTEVEAAMQRLSAAKLEDPKSELLNNLYPLLQLLSARLAHTEYHVLQRLALCESTLSEYLMGQESMITPELAQQINEMALSGLAICELLDKLQDLPSPLKTAVEGYRQSVAVTMQQVAAVVVDDQPDDDDEDDGDDDYSNGEVEDLPDVVADALAEAEAEAAAAEAEAAEKEKPNA